MYKNKDRYINIGIFILVIILFYGGIYYMYTSTEALIRDVRKSVVIDNQKLLAHELKTNEGFKVLLSGDVTSDTPVTDIRYLNDNQEYLYVETNEERYTRHTKTVTDSKGRTHIETHYSWDNRGRDTFKSSNITILNHTFPTEKLKFNNDYGLKLKSNNVSDRYKSKLSNNYIYLDGKIFHTVGDRRISFRVVDSNQYMSLGGELGGNTMKPYKKQSQIQVFSGAKSDVKKFLNGKQKFYAIIAIIVGIMFIGVYIFFKDSYF